MVRYGKWFEFEGSLFCIRNRNIVSDKSIVICKEIFFLEMGGKMKFMKVKLVMIK